MLGYSDSAALVTGANSGLGFEAAAQLAELGYGRVTLACRSEDKAATAARQLVERTGADVFDTLAVDVASIDSSRTAAADLVARDRAFDVVLLNAGMVPSELNLSDDGIEACFAASLIGHHIITEALLDANLLDDASVILVGSEAANNDLPKPMGMAVYDFVLGEDSAFGATPAEAMRSFATASAGPEFDGQRQYSTTKAFSAWWSAAMARRHAAGDPRFFTVSPGANMGTNAGRHAKGAFKLMVYAMSRVGRFIGMDQPVSEGAKRYLDVAHGRGGPYENGRTYTSRPKKMTGPIVVSEQPHLLDQQRQDIAVGLLDDLARLDATPSDPRPPEPGRSAPL